MRTLSASRHTLLAILSLLPAAALAGGDPLARIPWPLDPNLKQVEVYAQNTHLNPALENVFNKLKIPGFHFGTDVGYLLGPPIPYTKRLWLYISSEIGTNAGSSEPSYSQPIGYGNAADCANAKSQLDQQFPKGSFPGELTSRCDGVNLIVGIKRGDAVAQEAQERANKNINRLDGEISNLSIADQQRLLKLLQDRVSPPNLRADANITGEIDTKGAAAAPANPAQNGEQNGVASGIRTK